MVTISITAPTVKRKQRRGAKLSWHDFFGPFCSSSNPFVHHSWTNSLPFSLTFILSGIRKAERKGIYWWRTTKEDHLLFMWTWHLPPVDDVAAVPQLLHVIGLAPVYHDLKAG